MKIILGVCGSISAYRSLDICRGLVKNGHTVKVVLTCGALEFVKPEVFHYLGADEVFLPTDDFSPEAAKKRNVLHIELSKWAQRLVIAPASANTLAKLSMGSCDDLLSSIFLASPELDTIIYPAMNTNMLEHPLTKRNFQVLSELKNVFVHPTKEGLLACGDTGAGKLQDVDLIVETAPIISLKKPERKVLITAGATIAPLDPVRYLTNPSSGLTGYELAKTFLGRGDQVTLIAGPYGAREIDFLNCLPNCRVLKARTTTQVKEIVEENFAQSDLYISSAALSDIEFETSESKLKKAQMGSSLPFKKAPDVLQEAIKKRTSQKLVGFAAETSSDEEVFKKKWLSKPVDVLVGNQVSNGEGSPAKGFAAEDNDYIILKKGEVFFKGHLKKSDLGNKIMEALD